jgi:Zn-finger nucleic acid-binding protein
MAIESLNCPNCGGGVASDSTRCEFCRSRLKTHACPACLGLMFFGSEHCPRCGKAAVATETFTEENIGDCPRCGIKLIKLEIGDIVLRECSRCEGLWSDARTFEHICADREGHGAMIQWAGAKLHSAVAKVPVQYVPCPDCETLMNRSNFARSSGVVIDICKQHGVWFDAEELPRIIEFIHAGGMDRARQKEKLQLDENRRDLQQKEYMRSLDTKNSFGFSEKNWDTNTTISIRDFIRILFD